MPARSPRQQKANTYRAAVLVVIEAATEPLPGHRVAELAGLSYRQTVDALNALHNHSRIARIGRKYTARWMRVPPQPTENPYARLDEAMRSLIRAR